jgi:hypothetical protein
LGSVHLAGSVNAKLLRRGKDRDSLDAPFALDSQVSAVESFPATYL